MSSDRAIESNLNDRDNLVLYLRKANETQWAFVRELLRDEKALAEQLDNADQFLNYFLNLEKDQQNILQNKLLQKDNEKKSEKKSEEKSDWEFYSSAVMPAVAILNNVKKNGKYSAEIDDLFANYKEAYKHCASVISEALRRPLMDLLDQSFIAASNEIANGRIEKDTFGQFRHHTLRAATQLIHKTGMLARASNTNSSTIPNDLLTSMEKDVVVVGKRYIRVLNIWERIINYYEKNFKKTFVPIAKTKFLPQIGILKASHRQLVKGKQFTVVGLSSTAKVFNTVNKDGGAKSGANYDYIVDDLQKRFLIKKGGNLGETLAEFFAFLELKEMKQTYVDAKIYDADDKLDYRHAACTRLVKVKQEKTEVDEKVPALSLDEKVYVASEYYHSRATFTACQLVGHPHRPKMAGSRYGAMYADIIKINNDCKLGLEFALHDAIRVCDYDFHTENVLLNFEANADLFSRVKNEINALKKYLKEQTLPCNTDEICAKIKALQAKGVKVFFQKIDHGYAYYHYGNKNLKLDSSNILHSGQGPVNFSSGVNFQPTNHIAEWTERSPRSILLTDLSKKIIRANTIEKQQENLKIAIVNFRNYLSQAVAGNLLEQHQLWSAFYKHVTGMAYPREFNHRDAKQCKAEDVQAISGDLEKYIGFHRKRILDQHYRYYQQLECNRINSDEKFLKFLEEQRSQFLNERTAGQHEASYHALLDLDAKQMFYGK